VKKSSSSLWKSVPGWQRSPFHLVRWRLSSEPSIHQPVGVSPWPKLVSLVFLDTSSSLSLSVSLFLSSLFLSLSSLFFAAPKSAVVVARVSSSSPISSSLSVYICICACILLIRDANYTSKLVTSRWASRNHRDTSNPEEQPRRSRGMLRETRSQVEFGCAVAVCVIRSDVKSSTRSYRCIRIVLR